MNPEIEFLLRRTAAGEGRVAETLPLILAAKGHGGAGLLHFVYDEPYLADHLVSGRQLLLGVTHVALALSQGMQGSSACELKGVSFQEPVALEQGESALILFESVGERFSVLYQKNLDGPRLVTATGSMSRMERVRPDLHLPDWGIQTRPASVEEAYARVRRMGIVHGSSLQTLTRLELGLDWVKAELRLSRESAARFPAFPLHPALIDGAMIGLAALLPAESARPLLPLGLRGLQLFGPLGDSCSCVAKLVSQDEQSLVMELSFFDQEGRCQALVEGLICRFLATGDSRSKARRAQVSDGSTRESGPEQALVSGNEPALGTSLADRLRDFLTAAVSKAMKIRELNPEIHFLDQGADSAELVQLTQLLERELKLELYPTLLFEYPNLDRLAAYLLEKQGEALAAFFETMQEEEVKPRPEQEGRPVVAAREEGKRLEAQGASDTEIAVIGMAGYFPGASSPQDFWRALSEGRNLIGEIPADHFDYRPWFSPRPAKDKLYCKWGGFLERVGNFDADFFKISRLEAELMDPQLRLLLEVLYATAENAGQAGRIRGTHTGVYVGCCFADYRHELAWRRRAVEPHEGTGNASTMLANRPSFYFDLTGPSMVVDTACSSSLVALHLATRALRSGECAQAFVAGTNLMLSSWHYRYFCSIGALSPTGRCHSFDERADGYVPAEAVAALLLKPLRRALEDGDRIVGVIKGTAVNHGGYTPSVTAPSVTREAEVILAAWRDAGIDPATLAYLEAHGTGTKLGDPVEVEGLRLAFSRHTQRRNFCALGTAKAHIGHAEGAAGVTGVIKALLSIQKGEIPAMPEFGRLNPLIQLEGGPLYINRERRTWPNDAWPRRAGVSSFGFGGAYAHVVLEEAPQPLNAKERDAGRLKTGIATEIHAAVADARRRLFPLSAATPERLVARVSQLLAHLEAEPAEAADLARTLSQGREPLAERLAVVACGVAELCAEWRAFLLEPEASAGLRFRGKARRPARSAEGQAREQDWQAALTAGDLTRLAELWVLGAQGPWPEQQGNWLELPTYPFAGERYWILDEPQVVDESTCANAFGVDSLARTSAESERAAVGSGAQEASPDSPRAQDENAAHPLLPSLPNAEGTARFELPEDAPFFRDHRVMGRRVLPAAAYLEMALAAAAAWRPSRTWTGLANLVWAQPLFCDGDSTSVRIQLRERPDGTEFEIGSGVGPAIHARGRLLCDEHGEESEPLELRPELQSSTREGSECYRRFLSRGFEYGPTFQTLVRVHCGAKGALAELAPVGPVNPAHSLDPALLDGAFQAAMAAFDPFEPGQLPPLQLPHTLAHLRLFGPLTGAAYAQIESAGGSELSRTCHIRIFNAQGRLLVALTGFSGRALRMPMPMSLPILPPEPAASDVAAGAPVPSLGQPGASLPPSDPALPESKDSARTIALALLRTELAKSIKRPVEKVDVDETLDRFGIDSVLIMELTRNLESHFGELPKTLFFEYQTLRELADWLAAAHPEMRIRSENRAGSRLQLDPAGPLPPQVSSLPDPALTVSLPKGEWESGVPERDEPIAIIGMSGRYPGALDLESFWANLRAGRDLIEEVPAGRWDAAAFFDPNPNAVGKTYSRWGGFLSGIDEFDPLFFNLSPKEAALIDPQERLFLETAWQTLEDALLTRTGLAGMRVGVYVGVMWNQYPLLGLEETLAGNPQTPTGSLASIANRVSYFFDFQGPSIGLDTMCSSSLTAIQLACQALRSGECELALAGGVNLSLHPFKYLFLSRNHFTSSDGRCRSFGEGGDGYVPGEGVGAVLLKPLSRALADGDRIHGLIRAAELNHGGKTNGFTVPNPRAQGDLIRRALVQGGIEPRSIGYIEAHGTGTMLGDPIELAGLVRAFGTGTARNSCPIGSLKSNLGHLESAAGIAGLHKVLLQMREGELAPSLHAERLNPHLEFEKTPFYLIREWAKWPRLRINGQLQPRRAGLSSFGAGGSNAHLLIEESPTRTRSEDSRGPKWFVLSAPDSEGLRRYAERVLRWLERENVPNENASLEDLLFSFQVGREALAERLAFPVESKREWLEHLRLYLSTAPDPKRIESSGSLRSHSQAGPEAPVSPSLARRWCEGEKIDFRQHWQNPPRRVGLPGYPFSREPHWIPGRPAPSSIAAIKTTAVDASEQTLYLTPHWEPAGNPSLPGSPETQVTGLVVFASNHDQAHQLAGPLKAQSLSVSPAVTYREASAQIELNPTRAEDFERLATRLSAAPPTHYLFAWTECEDVDFLERAYLPLFRLVRGLFAERELLRVQPRLLVVVRSLERPEAAALAALVKTAALEEPRLEIRLAALGDPQTWATALARELALTGGPSVIRTRNGVREVERLSLLADKPRPAAAGEASVIRRGGVYLITGGLGGLGLIFARYLAQHFDARLVLLGRSPLDPEKAAQLAALNQGGARVRYQSVDVCDSSAVTALVAEILTREGELNGLIHAAGLLRDSLIRSKSESDLRAVLAPKWAAIRHLDQATAGLPLDWFLCCSSIAGFLGNPGQCDYAAGNAYLDAFALWRERERAVGRRSGQTISINWPLWKDGGMQVPPAAEAAMFARMGWTPLTTANGLAALRAAFTHPRLFVIQGERQRCLAFLHSKGLLASMPGAREELVPAAPASHFPTRQPTTSNQSETPTRPAAATGAENELRAALRERVRELAAHESGADKARIRDHEPWNNYGIESVAVMNLTAKLEQVFGELSKTLFFERQTVAELADYLAENHEPAARKWTGVQVPIQADLASAVSAASGTWPAQTSATLNGLTANSPLPSPWSRPRTGAPFSASETRIAVIGMAGRYPQSPNLQTFWTQLCEGRNCIAAFPRERGAIATPGLAGWGGFLEEIEAFDPLLFQVSPQDAAALDPQERLFLETAWLAFEDGGYCRARLVELQRRRACGVGVFVGCMYRHAPLVYDKPELEQGSYWQLANRVSHFFDLQGPSLAVDTACSASLSAVLLAVESLRRGDCALALAGGVNLSLHPGKFRQLAELGILGSEPSSRSLGMGDGYLPAEAVGAVLLKPLADALADGDRIDAIIEGGYMNHSGRSTGFGVPNPNAQAELVRRTLTRCGLGPDDIDYIEVAANGSPLGDPIEIAALTRAFSSRASALPIAIGSVKSNIGHAEAASGISQLSKVILQLRERMLVPSLHAKPPNPSLNLERTPFRIQQVHEPWPEVPNRPRRAALSSFGIGGSGTHLILAEAPPPPIPPAPIWLDQFFPLSARTPEALMTMAKELATWLRVPESPPLDLKLDLFSSFRQEIANCCGLLPTELDDDEPLADQGMDLLAFRRLKTQFQEVGEILSEWTERLTFADLTRKWRALFEGRKPASVSPGSSFVDLTRLSDLAFALQVGREPLEHRLAIIATNSEELHERLCAFAAGQPTSQIRGLRYAHAASGHPLLEFLDALGEELALQILERADLDRLARLWCHGGEIPWWKGRSLPRRIPVGLPGYPFARRNCAAPRRSPSPAGAPTAPAAPETPTARSTSPDLAEPSPKDWLTQLVAQLLGLALDELDPNRELHSYGADSLFFMKLSNRLARHTGQPIEAKSLPAQTSLAELAAFLAEQVPDASSLAKQTQARLEPCASDHLCEPQPNTSRFIFPFPADLPSPTKSESDAAHALAVEAVKSGLALWAEPGGLVVRPPRGASLDSLMARLAAAALPLARLLDGARWYPLSASQRRYWMLSLLQPGKAAYNNPVGVRLHGPLDSQLLERALTGLTARHEILRAIFPNRDHEPIQLIQPPTPLAISKIDLTSLNHSEAEARAHALAVAESRQPIQPHEGPCARYQLLRLASEDHLLLITVHHSLYDGFAFVPFFQELFAGYRALLLGKPEPQAPDQQYIDYILAERESREPRERSHDLSFWREQLAGAPAFTPLPFDFPRPALNRYQGHTLRLRLESERFSAFSAMLRHHRTSLFVGLSALIAETLCRWSGQTELVMGMTVQNRDRIEFEQVIGDFTNFLALRLRLPEQGGFSALLELTAENLRQVLAHKQLPFEQIAALAQRPPQGINPVYNLLVNQLPPQLPLQVAPGLTARFSHNRPLNQSAMLDLRFEWFESAEGLEFFCEYNTDLFRETTVRAWLQEWELRLAEVTLHPNTSPRKWPHLAAPSRSEQADSRLVSQPLTPDHEGMADQKPATTHNRAQTGDPDRILEELLKLFAEILLVPVDALDPDENFFELGGDSMSAVQIRVELEQNYGKLTTTELFRYPTARLLAAFLAERPAEDKAAGQTLVSTDFTDFPDSPIETEGPTRPLPTSPQPVDEFEAAVPFRLKRRS